MDFAEIYLNLLFYLPSLVVSVRYPLSEDNSHNLNTLCFTILSYRCQTN